METTKTYIRHQSSFQGENKRNLAVKIVMYFLWPFGAWLLALFRPNTKASFAIFFLFSLLICWHFAPTGYNDYYDDFLGIMNDFNKDHFTTDQVMNDLHLFFTFSEGAPKEMYREITTWMVKSISDNYHLYFFLMAIPVALCQLISLKRIVCDSRFKVGLIGFLIIAMFIFPRDIITVQNPRFATGFWINVAFTLMYYGDGKKIRYIIPILLSPFFHAGMWLYVGIFMASLIIPKKMIRPLEIVALVTIPLIFYDANLISDLDINFDLMPPGIRTWAEQHMGESYYEEFLSTEGRSGYWWIQAGFEFIMKVVYVWMTISLIRNKDKVEGNHEAKMLYGFYLFMFAVVNIVQFVPILGERYFWFTRVICLFVWFKAFAGDEKKMRLIYVLAASCLWAIVKRYGYILGGALSCNTPIDLYYMPLPYLLFQGVL